MYVQDILKPGIKFVELIPQRERMWLNIQNKLLQIDNTISAISFAGYFLTLYNLSVNRSEGRILQMLIRH